MPSTKRLRSVVHSIAHHSVSGLCYVHPHLGQACKETGTDRATINLLDSEPISLIEKTSPEIGLAAPGLREMFSRILRSEEMDQSDLSEALITFIFNRSRWPSGCYVQVTSIEGRAIEVAVDSLGNPAEIVSHRK